MGTLGEAAIEHAPSIEFSPGFRWSGADDEAGRVEMPVWSEVVDVRREAINKEPASSFLLVVPLQVSGCQVSFMNWACMIRSMTLPGCGKRTLSCMQGCCKCVGAFEPSKARRKIAES